MEPDAVAVSAASRFRTDSPSRTLLVTLTGRDRPGLLSQVFAAVASESDTEVLDVEQVVVRGRIVLGILLAAPDPENGLAPALQLMAEKLDLDIDVTPGSGDNDPRRGERLHVTLLGAPLHPGAVGAIAGRTAACGANIDRILRLARYPCTALELEVSGADSDELRAALAREAATQHVDVSVHPSGLQRRGKRLVVMDVDSTLIQDEVIELLAEHAGCAEQVAEVTTAAMAGELDFAASLRQRVRLLAGLPESILTEVYEALRLTPGARTLIRTLRRLDHKIAVVSGGFTQVIEPLAADLGIDFVAANTLEIVDGRITGELVGPILDRQAKADMLVRFAHECEVPLRQTVAIGDGANDLDMIQRAGLGVAFNAKPVLREAADTSLSVPYLDSLLFLLGIPRDEVEAADAEDDDLTPSQPAVRP
ncbi:MAG: phosphoserine phosphatase SerB [Streptosporangiales bacterium]|nr:phosphoserine phosphatase SerB [Streptosporangiales bacterium]